MLGAPEILGRDGRGLQLGEVALVVRGVAAVGVYQRQERAGLAEPDVGRQLLRPPPLRLRKVVRR